ncbi:MAG: hypothetical protein IPJ65_37385 [Archangiaceae bacterium]|nr:hypothetical protein [Archangiaceae bacterium]
MASESAPSSGTSAICSHRYATALAASLCVAALAWADNATVRMEYQRGGGAEACPDEQSLRDRVTARLGYDPFRAAAPLHLRLSIARAAAAGLVGRLEVLGAAGETLRQREISSEKTDCVEIAEALTLATSLAIDPFSVNRPRPAEPERVAPSPPQPAPVAPALAPVPPPAPVEDRHLALTPEVSVGVGLAFGLEPQVSVGFLAGARLKISRFSIGLEGRLGLPSQVTFQAASVSSSLLFASVLPCFHLGPLAGCALLSGGALRVSSRGLENAEPKTTPFLAAGARLELSLPVESRFFGRLTADLLGPLIRTSFVVDGQIKWSSPPVGGAVALVGGVRF